MARKYNIAYYVYVENINKHKIERYNVLNDGIIEEILSRVDKMTDKESFASAVEQILMYHYWSRSEWEIFLTDWPPHISKEELARLNVEQEAHFKEYGVYPYGHAVGLTIAEKIDVYDQVMLNWNIFIDYVWENLKGVLK